MSTAELNRIKSGLIEWISQMSDVKLITAINKLRFSKSKEDWWDELSDVEKEIVQAGIDDADKGNLISSEEFWRQLKNA